MLACKAPAGLASAPLAVVLADDGAPAVLAVAPDAVMLADAGASLAPPNRWRAAPPC